MAIVEQTSMKSQPIPITVSTCSIDRKSISSILNNDYSKSKHFFSFLFTIHETVSNSNEETTGLITRSYSISDTRAHSLENEKSSDTLKESKKMPTLEKENSIALSWNDVSVAGGGGREPRHSATSCMLHN